MAYDGNTIRKRETKKYIHVKTMTTNSPKLTSHTKSQIQESQRTPRRIRAKK